MKHQFLTIFVWHFSHTSQCQRYFISLFVCLCYESNVLVAWFLVWLCRREKTVFQYTVSCSCFVGGHFFFQLLVFSSDIYIFSRCALVHRVTRNRFLFFSVMTSLSSKTFTPWVHAFWAFLVWPAQLNSGMGLAYMWRFIHFFKLIFFIKSCLVFFK